MIIRQLHNILHFLLSMHAATLCTVTLVRGENAWKNAMSSFITIRLPRCSTIQLNRLRGSVAASSTLFFFLSIHILEKNHTALVRSLWPLYDDIWSIMIQIQVVSIPQFTQKMKRHFSRESTSLNITAVGANTYIVEKTSR